jgi:hypothetical protein
VFFSHHYGSPGIPLHPVLASGGSSCIPHHPRHLVDLSSEMDFWHCFTGHFFRFIYSSNNIFKESAECLVCFTLLFLFNLCRLDWKAWMDVGFYPSHDSWSFENWQSGA